MAIEKLEEGVLAHFLNILESIDLEELIVLFSVDFPWHFLEKECF